ncbi:MAG: SpoIIE family protein phosphatase [Actinomycetota bacterium]
MRHREQSAAAAVADRARERLQQAVATAGADRGTLWQHSRDDRLVLVAAVGYPPELIAAWPTLLVAAQLPASLAARSGRPVTVAGKDELERRFPELTTRPTAGAEALACLPIGAGGRVDGVLGLAFRSPHDLEDVDVVRLQALADSLAGLLGDGEVAVLRDALRGAERRLDRSAGRWGALAESVLDGVWIADDDGQAVEGGAAWQRLTGLPAQRFGGSGWLAAVHPQDRPATERAWRDGISDGVAFETEYRAGRPGHWRTLRTRGVPVVEGGSVVEWVVAATDVTAVRDAQRAQDALQHVMAVLAPVLSVQEVAVTVATALPGFLGAYSANLAMLDDDGATLRFLQVSRGFADEAVREWMVFDLASEAPVADAVRTGQPVFNRNRTEFVAGRPHLEAPARASGVHAWASLPLVARGRTLGALGLTWLAEREFPPSEQAHLEAVAEACALALDRARQHEQDHGIAVALQHALLPQTLPHVPGLTLAARYLPAAEGTAVGGDWYDVWRTSPGRLAVALGDVMGHGPAPAAVMGQVRAATRAFVTQSDSPVHVATCLDRLFADFEVPDAMATLLFAVIDLDARTVEVVNLGHLPPLVTAHGATTALAVETGLPLGVTDAPARFSATFALAAGATLVLCSDGLVEDRRRPVTEGLAELARVVSSAIGRHDGDVSTVCDAVLHDMLAGRGHEDDVALLLVHLGEVVADAGNRVAELSLGPERSSARLARRWAAGTVRAWGLDALQNDVELLVTELVSNAVLHGQSSVDVALRRLDDGVRLEVTDRFGGHPVVVEPGTDAQGGRGLLIVAQVARDWGYDRTDVGKRVWAELGLRPAAG